MRERVFLAPFLLGLSNGGCWHEIHELALLCGDCSEKSCTSVVCKVLYRQHLIFAVLLTLYNSVSVYPLVEW